MQPATDGRHIDTWMRNGPHVNFAMDEDLVELADSVGDFLASRGDARAIAEAAGSATPGQWSRWAALCEMGLPALRLPAPDGVGARLLEATAVAERLGAVLLPEPAVSAIVLARALQECSAGGLLDELLAGSRVIGLCGHDTATLTKEAVLQGTICAPADDMIASVAVVATRGQRESALVVFDASQLPAPRARLGLDLTRPWAEVDVSGLEPTHVLAIPEESAWQVRSAFAVLTLAELVGGMQAMLNATITYVTDREQFGRSLGSFQAVKHRLADMYVATERSRAAVQFAAIACDTDSDIAPAIVGAAARWIPRSAIEVFDSAIHLHGAMGYSWELPIHLHLRRAMVTRQLLGRSDVQATT